MAVNLTHTTLEDIWQNGIQCMDCDQIQKDLMAMVVQFKSKANLEYEVLADKWPVPSVLIYRPSAETYKKASKYLSNTYVLSSCEEATTTWLQNAEKDNFQHNRLFVFFTTFKTLPIAKELSPCHGFSVRDPYRKLAIYKLDKDQICLNNCKLPDSYISSNVTIEDASFITGKWETGRADKDENSLMFIEYLIKYGMSIGIKDKDGQLVAWSLQYPWGPLGVLHVVEEHRKTGLGSFVLMAIADKIAQKNGYALSEVPLDNELSLKLHEKCGFKLISKGEQKILDIILVLDECKMHETFIKP